MFLCALLCLFGVNVYAQTVFRYSADSPSTSNASGTDIYQVQFATGAALGDVLKLSGTASQNTGLDIRGAYLDFTIQSDTPGVTRTIKKTGGSGRFYNFNEAAGTNASMTLKDLSIQGSDSVITNAIGLFLHNSTKNSTYDLTIDNVTFSGFKNGNYKGGVICVENSSLALNITVSNGLTFDTNRTNAAYGGAIDMENNGKLTITGDSVIFNNNYAKSYGGAIHGSNTNITANIVKFTNNTANEEHGGAVNLYGGTLTITGNGNNPTVEFSGNRAAKNGGAIRGNSAFSNGAFTFSNNTAGTNGGAIFSETAVTFSCDNTSAVFTGNTAATGNDLYLYGSSGTVLSFTDSGTYSFDGGIYVEKANVQTVINKAQVTVAGRANDATNNYQLQNVSITNGGKLTAKLDNINSLTGTFNVGSTGSTGTMELNVGADVSKEVTFSDSFKVTGDGALVKSGAGTLTLYGANSYVGETKVSGGTLVLANGANLASSKVTVGTGATFKTGTNISNSEIVLNGGAFVVGATSDSSELTIDTITLNSGKICFDFNNAYGDYDADWLHVSSATLNTGYIDLTFNSSSADEWWTVINGYENGFSLIDGDIVNYEQFNSNNVKVSVNGTPSNSWRLEAREKELVLYAADGGDDPGPGPGPDPGDNTWYDANTSDIYETSWTIDGTNKVGAKFTDGGSDAPFSGNVYMNADGTFNVSGARNLTLSNAISGSGAIDKTGDGTLTLGAANSNFTGATKVSEGTLALTAQNAISNSSSVENNGAITMGAAQSLNNLSGTGTIDNGGNALTLNNTAPSEFSGVISGSGAMVKSGSGTLTLSGANTYTGATTVNAGALTLASGGALASNEITIGSNSKAEMTIASGATVTTNGAIYVGLDNGSDGTLNIEGGTVNAYWLRPGRNAGSKGVVNISGGVVTFSKPSSVSGYDESEIGNNGSGKITVSGNAKLIFTGTARIANMGKAESFINIQDNGEMSVKNLFVGQRGTNLGSMTLSGHAKLTIENELNVGTNSGSKGSGTMTLKDYATVTLGGTARSYVGYNSGTSTLNVSDNASFTATGKGFLIGESGKGVINQTGGTITLNPTEGQVFLADGANGQAELNISGGKLNIKKTLIAGTRGVATINLSANGEINADETVALAPGYTTGSSSIVNQTGGTFNANNGIVYGNYYDNRGAGVYKLSGGTLNSTSVKYNSNKAASASFEVSGSGIANITGEVSVPTTVSGGTLNAKSIIIPAGKELTVSGGTVNLGEGGITAAGAYTVNLSGGTLATKGASWSSALNATVAADSTVTFAPEAEQSITWNGALSGSGSVAKSGAGTLTLAGSNSYSGETTVSGGTLVLPASASLATSQITVNSGATFQTGASVDNSDVVLEGGALVLGTTNAVTDITVGDFALTGGSVWYDFFASTSSDNHDFLYTNDAALTSGTINIAFTNNDENDWWNQNTDSGYVLIESYGLTADNLNNIRLLVNSERTTRWTLDTDGDNLVLKNQTEPAPDRYYHAESEEERQEDSWTIDGSVKQGVTFTEGEQNAVTYSGDVIMEGAGSFDVDADRNLTLDGDVSGSGEITKQGGGTLTLSGDNNTNTGKTTISEGTLALTGDAVKANNPIEIAQDATLEYNVPAGDPVQLAFSEESKVSGAGNVIKTGKGTLKILATDGLFESDKFAVKAGELDFKGQYNGDLEVENGATLSPGNSIGDLTVYGNVKVDTGGTLLFEFSSYNDDPAMREFDTLSIKDTDVLKELILDTGSLIKLSFLSGDASDWATEGNVYQLVSDAGFADDVTPLEGFLGYYENWFRLEGRPEGLFLIGLGAPESGSGVPEPSTWALMILGAAGLLYMRKRNK